MLGSTALIPGRVVTEFLGQRCRERLLWEHYSKYLMARCPKWLEKEDGRKEVGNRYGAETSQAHLRGVLHRMRSWWHH